MSAPAIEVAKVANRADDPSHIDRGTRLGRIRRVGGFIALGLGVLTLLFVGHQMWITDLLQQRAQAELRDEFAASMNARASAPGPSIVEESMALDATVAAQTPRGADPEVVVTQTTLSPVEPAVSSSTEQSRTEPPPVVAAAASASEVPAAATVAVAQEAPARGAPIAQLLIPKIGVDQIVVEGTGREQLERGPGHYVGTPLPGQYGNVSFAAHRTTYGAPFGRLDELVIGDVITVRSADGSELVYHVTDQFVVAPSRSDVVGDQGDHRLTLTTCTPKASATSRLIVVAHSAGSAVPGLHSVSQRADVSPVSGNRSVSQRADSGDVSPVSGNRSVSQRADGAPVAATASVLADESPTARLGVVDSPVAPWLPTAVWSVGLALVLVLARWLYRRSTWWVGAAVAIPLALVVLNSLFISVGRLLPPSF
jgi:LPXTG-site transpeptidase (sortase) family protein